MKCNVCKYYLPQVGLIDAWFPLREKLKFKSSLSHQHTLLFRLHYSSQSLHYSFHLASHFVTWFIYKEPLKVSIITIIISCFFACEGWGLAASPLPVSVVLRRLCGMPGFYLRAVTPEPRIWPGAKQRLRCPSGHHNRCQLCVWTVPLQKQLLKYVL